MDNNHASVMVICVLFESLRLLSIEHSTTYCHSSTDPGLERASLGRVTSCDCLVNIDYRIRLRALRQQKHPLVPAQPGKKPMAMGRGRGGEGVTKLVSWGGSISGHNANEPNSFIEPAR